MSGTAARVYRNGADLAVLDTIQQRVLRLASSPTPCADPGTRLARGRQDAILFSLLVKVVICPVAGAGPNVAGMRSGPTPAIPVAAHP
jgi:hypothetical protein